MNSGIFVQRAKIRASIHRVDPVNTTLRRGIAVQRHVAGPNCVWHVDTNHKSIKWRIVIQGCIDGYSRTIVYLRCSSNNRSSTNFSFFIDVEQYGLPEKIRSDLCGENYAIWRYMVEEHNCNSAVITGSKGYGEMCTVVLFCDTFCQLEDLGTLNKVDMYCLHFVSIGRIDRALKSFTESWNNHHLSTENRINSL